MSFGIDLVKYWKLSQIYVVTLIYPKPAPFATPDLERSHVCRAITVVSVIPVQQEVKTAEGVSYVDSGLKML